MSAGENRDAPRDRAPEQDEVDAAKARQRARERAGDEGLPRRSGPSKGSSGAD